MERENKRLTSRAGLYEGLDPLEPEEVLALHLIEAESFKRNAGERGYAFVSSSAKVDLVAEKFEEVLDLAVRLAEVEETLKRLAREIEVTKRRVNALEYIIIPRMEATVKFIKQRLDEMERENFFRLKRVKALIEARGGS